MADARRRRVMLDVLEEHFEELDFLWQQREDVLFAPDWNLTELIALEERAEAHLDGLRIGESHSVEIARPHLLGEERGAATAATFTLMAMDSAQMEEAVVAALAAAPPEARDGIRIGLRHSDILRVRERLSSVAGSGEPAVRAAAADILAFHRLPPPPRLSEMFDHPDPKVRRLAITAAGRFGGPWSSDFLEDALSSQFTDVRTAALECSARLGIPNLPALCRRSATRPEKPVPEALAFLGIVAEGDDVQLLKAAIGRPTLTRAALSGLGRLGSIAAVPALIDAMTIPEAAHAAGRAFVRITGASNIEADEAPPPPPEIPDEEVDFRDETRPPDPGRARSWWEKRKSRFSERGRWQAGVDVSVDPLGAVFNDLPLETRRDVYLGARAARPDKTPDFELEERTALRARNV